jgi:cell division transport system ATP-binding protein
MIQLLNVSKTYANGVAAINDISVKIDKGELVFLVGSSGAGKSTLIRMLFREEIPTKGQIFVGGKSIVRMTRKETSILRRNMGIVFQDFKLLQNRTVFENIAFAMEVLEATPKEIKNRVPLILEMVGLGAKARYYTNQLSGGEQQRVAIARAIVNGPKILVADEPTGNLDPDTSWGIMELLSDINLRGTTVIMATHDKMMVDKMRKRVIALEQGRIVRDQQGGLYCYED